MNSYKFLYIFIHFFLWICAYLLSYDIFSYTPMIFLLNLLTTMSILTKPLSRFSILYFILLFTLIYSTMIYNTILYYPTLCSTILHYTILSYTTLYYTIIYYTILSNTVLHCIQFYFTLLHNILWYLGCLIAGIDLKKVSTMDSSDCLVATYARKLQGLRAPEKASLEVR